ncbi:MAG: hypothetical protein ACEQSA_03895 [Weeksellaceae bacterium]
MLYAHVASYTGKQPHAGYVGTFAEQDIFVILAIEEGVTPEEGKKMLESLKTALLSQPLATLESFENAISQQMLRLNVPAHFSLAGGLFKEKILYVKTVGAGEIYFRRSKDFDKLMDGDKSASGYLQEFDCAVLTTSKIHEVIGENPDIKAFVDLYAPQDVVERMENEEYTEEERGFVSLFVEFNSEPADEPYHVLREEKTVEATYTMDEMKPVVPASSSASFPFQTVEEIDDDPEKETFITDKHDTESSVAPPTVPPVTPPTIPTTPISPPPVIEGPLQSVEAEPVLSSEPPTLPPQNVPAAPVTSVEKKSFKLPFLSSLENLRTKKIAVIAAVIIFAILIWSVVFGYQRRAEAQLQQRVEAVEMSINEKLTQAEDDAIIDLDGALALLTEAKQELDDLKKEVGGKKQSDVERIAKRIQTTEATLLKKEEKAYEEFYDLALENEKAKGDAVYYTDGSIVMLDQQNKTVYVLDQEQKSLDKYTAAEVSAASRVALYEDKLYILNPDAGVFEFTSETKTKKVIDADSDWGSIADIEIYNGNIYLLDEDNVAIYKYLVTANGFGDITDYFVEDQSAVLTKPSDLVIDSSVYVASPDSVVKYTQGATDEFETTYPVDSPAITGVYTDSEIEQVYAWSTQTATVYIMDKNGTYERQIQSGIIKKAKGIFVIESVMYIFDGQKIYTILLN